MSATPSILTPFDKRESMSLAEAAKLAGRSEGTLKTWCHQWSIGRRVAGGPWCVSRVALAMLLDGDAVALRAYHAGDRHGPLVAPYYERLGLTVLLNIWPPTGPTKSAETTNTANTPVPL
jgi:hypothetical protein